MTPRPPITLVTTSVLFRNQESHGRCQASMNHALMSFPFAPVKLYHTSQTPTTTTSSLLPRIPSRIHPRSSSSRPDDHTANINSYHTVFLVAACYSSFPFRIHLLRGSLSGLLVQIIGFCIGRVCAVCLVMAWCLLIGRSWFAFEG
jgi:hypothetical protein